MTSHGQRFRRRALRRGYKVDEVDAFLDRVEATLAGNPGDAPVAAQEVHDVVFRVRFGGYDEWQVDLHLDRVERQLAEHEERTSPYGREQRVPQVPDRMAPPPDRMGPPPVRDDRMMAPPVPPPSMMPPMQPPSMPPRPVSPVPGPPPGGGFDRYDEPTSSFGGGFDQGFEPGRHGKSDMTTEIRMPDRGFDQPYGPGPVDQRYGPGPVDQPYPPVGPPAPGMPPEVARIDQLRRTFQLRRFGSGYDRVQVDRLFETVVDALSGRTGVPLSEAELDSAQFSLVPGGYFEAEVDAALKEVRDILIRRR